MDDIRKKMESLRSETQNALNRASQFEKEAKAANTLADKNEELVWFIFHFYLIQNPWEFQSNWIYFRFISFKQRDLQKKFQHIENDFDLTLEKMTFTLTKLDEKEKAFQLADSEIQVVHL